MTTIGGESLSYPHGEGVEAGSVAESSATQGAVSGAFTLRIHPPAVAKVLAVVIVFLVVVGTIANIIIYHVAPDPDHKIARMMQRFDLGFEPSLANWYSSIVLLTNAGIVWLVAFVKRHRSEQYVRHWFALGFVMLYMAIDEAIMIHEMFDSTLRDVLQTGGILYFAWVIPGAAMVLAVGLGFSGFLRHLDSRTRTLFVAAGTIFVAGAIGMELIAGLVMDAHGSIAAGVLSLGHTFEQAAEEGLEMFGALIFLYANLDLLSRDLSSVRCSLSIK